MKKIKYRVIWEHQGTQKFTKAYDTRDQAESMSNDLEQNGETVLNIVKTLEE